MEFVLAHPEFCALAVLDLIVLVFVARVAFCNYRRNS